MATLRLSADATADLVRLVDFLRDHDPEQAVATASIILDGMAILAAHPLVGRRAGKAGHRDLMISRGRTGYVARYVYSAEWDEVLILRLRHQRERDSSETDPPHQ